MEKKARLVTYISIAVLLLAFGLLAIPQFIVPNDYPILESISGYQFFFHAVDTRYENLSGINGVSGQGIAVFVLMVLALGSFCFARKSSALLMLGGLLDVVASILFFAMEASKKVVYGSNRSFVNVGWTNYLIGGLLVLCGLIAIYYAFRSMRSEKKQFESKQSYSYLKK